jgi:hypothetical protein
MIPIQFKLTNITTSQFAILEDMADITMSADIYSELGFGVMIPEKNVVVSAQFRFKSDNKEVPFLIIETQNFFGIEENSWESIYNAENSMITLPKGFAQHLAVLSVGTARGVLHAKTEGTKFNICLLPLINVEGMVAEDVIIDTKETEVHP